MFIFFQLITNFHFCLDKIGNGKVTIGLSSCFLVLCAAQDSLVIF